MPERRVQAVLFDLDGTLVDTAPDLAAAVNRVLAEQGLPAVAPERLRAHTSKGIRGLLAAALAIDTEHEVYADYADHALRHYAERLCEHSCLFEGMDVVLSRLEEANTKWGIVTNKHSRFTQPLVRALNLDTRAACVVSGDTAARPKPAPDPLLHACAQMRVDPQTCLYVGDDLRDITAGHAAGMTTVAVRWGYLGEEIAIENWGADYIIAEPKALLRCL